MEQSKELAIAEHARKVDLLATQLGYQGVLSVGALEDGIRLYQRRTVEDCIELGKCLVLLKEITPHGEFTQRISILNINERTARRFMSAALKFSKTDNFPVLNAVGNQSKLLELLVLDDDEIAELSTNGSINDITLDDIDCMTASELRKKLRETKADSEAKDKLLQSKDEKINKLDTELTKANSPTAIAKREETEQQQLCASALESVNIACLTMHNDVVRFTNSVNSIQDAIEQHGLYNIQEQLEANVVALFQQIAQTTVDLGIQIDFNEMVNPSWMTQATTEISEEA